jgi:hypothetical protein
LWGPARLPVPTAGYSQIVFLQLLVHSRSSWGRSPCTAAEQCQGQSLEVNVYGGGGYRYKWMLSPLNGLLHTRYSSMAPRCKALAPKGTVHIHILIGPGFSSRSGCAYEGAWQACSCSLLQLLVHHCSIGVRRPCRHTQHIYTTYIYSSTVRKSGGQEMLR